MLYSGIMQKWFEEIRATLIFERRKKHEGY
jgi:hypothetical protein